MKTLVNGFRTIKFSNNQSQKLNFALILVHETAEESLLYCLVKKDEDIYVALFVYNCNVFSELSNYICTITLGP